VEVARSFKSTVSHRIIIRYRRDGVPTTAKLTHEKNGTTRTFSIDGVVNDDERNVWHILYCTEVTG
jgi:hypothetical protein